MTPEEEKAEKERQQIKRLRQQCRKLRDYYNTNHEVGDELKASKEKAMSENELVYGFFLRNDKPYAVFQIIRSFYPGHIIDLHIRSISRAVSTLKKADVLEITDTRIMGHKGKNVHLYRLKPQWRVTPQPPKSPKQMELF